MNCAGGRPCSREKAGAAGGCTATRLGAMPSPQPINVFAKLDVLEWLDTQRAGGADLGPSPRLVLIAGIKADLMGFDMTLRAA